MNISPYIPQTQTQIYVGHQKLCHTFSCMRERERESERQSERDTLGVCMLHIDIFFCLNMRFKVLSITAIAALDSCGFPALRWLANAGSGLSCSV